MRKLVLFLLNFVIYSITMAGQKIAESPNILWIYVDDMSDWMGCYGDNTVPTPNIDALATNGVRFSRAYMPCPVCSPTRSALITGTMQTTHGLHHHETLAKKPLPEGITTLPELFRKAGYLTFNEAKTHYNFSYHTEDLFSPEFERPPLSVVNSHLTGFDLTWLKQLQGKKFFGQIQLSGGKWQGEAGSKYPAYSRVSEQQVVVPPQYPDNSVFRNAIARHYEQIAHCDSQVGAIIQALKEYGLWENTAVFFFSDHGCQMPRAKQFVYEEGAKVPLIVHWPDGYQQLVKNGKVRDDLVNGIDISVSTLALAGIKVPDFMEGKDLFDKKYKERDFVVTARDRMGIAIDRVRAIRTGNYLYIRNYMTDRPLYQAGYRDEYATFVKLRQLHAEGKLTPLQASYHEASLRPAEELYDIKNDVNQLINLAGNPKYDTVLKRHRKELEDWVESTDDKGQYSASREDLEMVFKAYPNKCVNPEYDIFRNPGEVNSDKKELSLPPLENGLPSPGKRVAIVPAEYEGTDVHHLLCLPPDWDPEWKKNGRSWPVIVEYTGNSFPPSGSTGEVEGAALGYGLSGGKFIWAVLPFVAEDHTHNEVTWWGDEKATAEYAKRNVPRICKEFGGDSSRVFLCGFSRGAIAVNYIGLFDDDIARLWCGFISHDHYDGVREWRGTAWGSPLDIYRSQAIQRLKRLNGRPVLICQNEGTREINEYLTDYKDLAKFTFLDIPVRKIFPEIPNAFMIDPHTDRWIFVDSKERRQAWEWMENVLQIKTNLIKHP